MRGCVECHEPEADDAPGVLQLLGVRPLALTPRMPPQLRQGADGHVEGAVRAFGESLTARQHVIDIGAEHRGWRQPSAQARISSLSSR